MIASIGNLENFLSIAAKANLEMTATATSLSLSAKFRPMNRTFVLSASECGRLSGLHEDAAEMNRELEVFAENLFQQILQVPLIV